MFNRNLTPISLDFPLDGNRLDYDASGYRYILALAVWRAGTITAYQRKLAERSKRDAEIERRRMRKPDEPPFASSA